MSTFYPRMYRNKGFYKWGWGIVEGCQNGCEYCYAAKRSARRGRDFTVPIFRESLLGEPAKVKPSRIFVNHLGDIMCFDSDVVNKIIDVCRGLPEHEFLFMSKLPEKYSEYSFPDNCVLGVTIESPDKWSRAKVMKKYKRTMCSVEPILGDFTGKDFSQFEYVVVGSLKENNKHDYYDSVKHDKIYYTR